MIVFDSLLSKGAKHWKVGLLCMSLLFGTVCILPNIWQRMDTMYPFQGIEALGADQEHFYAARIREVMDGHWGLGDPYHADKNLPYLQPPFPEWVMGGIALMLGLMIGPAILLIKFLFGALLFVSMAIFWIRMTDRPWISILATSAVLFSWFLFSAPWVLLDALSGLPLSADFARFSRLTNPQFSGMLFFLALYFGVDWFRGGGLRSILITAFIVGLSFYAYPYTWSYLLVVFGLLFLWSLFLREWRRVRELGWAGLLTGGMAIPFVVHTMQVLSHPSYPDLAERFGLIASRVPVGGAWLILFVLLAYAAGRHISPAPRFLASLALGAVIVMNQQIVTGTVIVPHHYHWYFIHPLAVATLVLSLCVFFQSRVRRSGFLFGLLLFTAIFWGVRYQWHAYRSQRQMWGGMQQAAGVFSFLEMLPEPTVYADDLVGNLIPVFTRANMSFAGAANVGCLCSFDLIRDSYFLELWLKGVTVDEVARTFPTTERASVSAKLFGLYYREAKGAYERIPDNIIQETIDDYRVFAASSLKEKLRRTPTDIYIRRTDASENEHVRELLRFGTKVYGDAYYEAWDIASAMR